MQRALSSRDASFDGVFFVAVKTTRVFCRPSCPARKPLARNVVYFVTAADALFAGFRACKRCRPLQTASLPDWAERLRTAVDRHPHRRYNAAELRKHGIDPARTRRLFLKHFNLTFHAYVRARRLSDALAQIRQGTSIDDVAIGSGYRSHSGFRSAFSKTFGTPPGRSRETVCILTRYYDSPLGPIVLAATDAGLCLAEFADRRMLEAQFRTLRRRFNATILPGSNRHLEQAARELAEYFAGERRQFTVSLDRPGSAFQMRVWDAVAAIPYGQTRSYEQIAQTIGSKGPRAVGHANGLNRLAIFIPCHRVITKQGTLGGYGGGLWRKQRLLDLESSS